MQGVRALAGLSGGMVLERGSPERAAQKGGRSSTRGFSPIFSFLAESRSCFRCFQYVLRWLGHSPDGLVCSCFWFSAVFPQGFHRGFWVLVVDFFLIFSILVEFSTAHNNSIRVLRGLGCCLIVALASCG